MKGSRSPLTSRQRTTTVRRDPGSVPVWGFGGGVPSVRCLGGGARRRGFEGGRSVPSPEPSV